MGMSIEDCIHKLDFSIKGYQKLIDEHVSDGQVVGTGVRGEWSANTPLNEAYQSHIDAYKMAKDIVRKYQKIQELFDRYDKGELTHDMFGLFVGEVLEDETND